MKREGHRLKIMIVAGARPNFMKAAPVYVAAARAGHDVRLLHTGQHYDVGLSDSMFQDLDLPGPDFHLRVGSASHAQQTARIMEAFEPVLLETRPHCLVVLGDVNSTLACALVAAKLKEETGCRIAHVEAGLRSRDWRMPEEVNRVLTDQLADLLFTPSRDGDANLRREGIPDDRIVFVGNVMVDTLLSQLPRARRVNMRERLEIPSTRYIAATLHRPSNVDEPEVLRTILMAFAELHQALPVVLPVHPRTRQRCTDFGFLPLLDNFITCEPLSYLEMLALSDGAAAVLTDSGGLQEESTVLGVPCVTLREGTERPATLMPGTNRMAQWPLTARGIVDFALQAAAEPRAAVGSRCPEGWDGRAADRIVAALSERIPPGPLDAAAETSPPPAVAVTA